MVERGSWIVEFGGCSPGQERRLGISRAFASEYATVWESRFEHLAGEMCPLVHPEGSGHLVLGMRRAVYCRSLPFDSREMRSVIHS